MKYLLAALYAASAILLLASVACSSGLIPSMSSRVQTIAPNDTPGGPVGRAPQDTPGGPVGRPDDSVGGGLPSRTTHGPIRSAK
jgi:hypothetical protein